MKTKTDAAKVLLENGWTFEEVEKALGNGNVTAPIIIREPCFVPQPYVVNPYAKPYREVGPWVYEEPTIPIRITETWCGTSSATTANDMRGRVVYG